MNCNVCSRTAIDPIFASAGPTALTSLCELRAGRVEVWSCTECGHLFAPALQNTEEYYSTDYRILLSHDDEDQIYETGPSGIVYRTEHQLQTLLARIAIPNGTKVLDYGCAKASTPARLLGVRPDVQLHLFDVSDMYLEYWKRILPADRYAINETPDGWVARFDLITSFFALEHIPRPPETIAHIHRLLRDGGRFYCVIPDTFGNVADFVVIDHVNHFTEESLRHLLTAAGFVDIDVDSTVHRGAHVVTAIKRASGIPPPLTPDRPTRAEVANANARAAGVAEFWRNLDAQIQAAELAAAGLKSAIYGSGFYGAYIMSLLLNKEDVICFLDRSPFQQGKTLHGRPIFSPDSLPESVKLVYVGLNPVIAKAAIAELPALTGRDLTFIYLEGSPRP